MNTKKLVLISFLAVGTAFPLAASAQEAGLYIGGSIGRSDTDNDTSGLTAAGATVTGSDEKDTGWKGFVGYQFNKTWGIEASYVDLGDFGVSGTVGVTPFTGKVDAKGYSLAATATLPMTDQFSFFAKLGAAKAKLKSSFSSPALNASSTDNESGWTAGLGVKYDITKSFAIRAEFDRYDFGDSGEANLYTVGVQFKF